MYEYTSPEQQIKKLKQQNLSFIDEKFAIEKLKTYGYYNIINGYRDPYITRDYSGKQYTPGITFEQIFSLFALDHALRDSVLLSMIDLEEHLRAVVSDIIAEDFGSDHNLYLNKQNYRDKYVSNPRFRRNNILNGINKIANTTDKQPVKYYRENHNIIPPWILFKAVPFGSLVNLIRFFKSEQRNKLVRTLYRDRVNSNNLEIYKDILSDSLYLCLEYRNLAAHGGRIYNYIPAYNVRFCDDQNIHKGLPNLLSVLHLFQYQQPFKALDNRILQALSEYCNLYPNDLSRIEQATGFHIKMERHVWVNKKTLIYHKEPHCSGANKCIEMPYDQAIALGFSPCKRCSK